MPKRLLAIAFAAGALALAACNNNTSNLFGSATPTPGPTTTYTPNPTASTAVAAVTYGGAAVASQPVDLSTPDANGHPGAVITTQTTNASGQATFSNLTPATTYCFASSYTPPTAPPTPLPRSVSVCSNLWGLTGVTIRLAF